MTLGLIEQAAPARELDLVGCAAQVAHRRRQVDAEAIGLEAGQHLRGRHLDDRLAEPALEVALGDGCEVDVEEPVLRAR